MKKFLPNLREIEGRIKIPTPTEMQKIDKKAIEEIGIPGVVLMENAGRGIFNIIQKKFPEVKTVLIICGKGNNGGDGFVVGRYLLKYNKKVSFILLGKKENMKGDAKVNLEIVEKMNADITEITQEKESKILLFKFQEADIIIDGIFGTGFKGEVKGVAQQVIKEMNSSNKPIVSIDVPSGLDAETGEIGGECVCATITCTMCLPKRGLFLYPGKEYVGELYIVDIGVPSFLWNDISLELLSPLNLTLPFRSANSHKGTFGKVFILAGSRGMTGASALAVNSALRIGVGLVRLGIPEELNSILEEKITEGITVPLPQTKEGTLSYKALEKIKEEITKADAVGIGPGLSTHPETKKLIREVIKYVSSPLIIDADGLNNLTFHLIEKISSPTIITPHPGELSRLINKSISQIQSNRVEIAKEVANQLGIIVVLKGAPTIVASSHQVFLLPIYTSALAKGGTGDVLTGIILGLLGQKVTPIEGAKLGVYIHGRVGEILGEKLTNYSPVAGDMVEWIPLVLKEMN